MSRGGIAGGGLVYAPRERKEPTLKSFIKDNEAILKGYIKKRNEYTGYIRTERKRNPEGKALKGLITERAKYRKGIVEKRALIKRLKKRKG